MKSIFRTTVIAIILSLGAFGSSYAQTYKFYYSAKEQAEVQASIIKQHNLGEEIAKKMQLLKESYTYKEYNPVSRFEDTVIEKTPIYNSVKKISKYLSKSVKKGNIELEEAQSQLNKILDVALNIRHQNTTALEEELWATKGTDQIASIFVDKIVMDR